MLCSRGCVSADLELDVDLDVDVDVRLAALMRGTCKMLKNSIKWRRVYKVAKYQQEQDRERGR